MKVLKTAYSLSSEVKSNVNNKIIIEIVASKKNNEWLSSFNKSGNSTLKMTAYL